MPKVPFWVFIIIGLLYFNAARIDTMDVDASQYAEMSREMMISGDYLHMHDRGMEYLDKPPFLFWASSLSMKVFGVNNFGYKLPSILFAFLAIFATYRLARLLYNEATARMAALILAACQGMFLMTNDVRCDTILMSWVITAIWLLKEWDVSKKTIFFFGGCACIAFGMMTKGPIALMVPIFAFASDWALKREWKKFMKWIYLPGLLLIAILLIPMSIGLYQQFDMHPEKLVNNKYGVSGLRFFFWSQSFGRITGESPWNNGADISFLLLNMLWSFLPWIFLFLTAFILNIIQVAKQKFRLSPGQEWLTTGGFLLAYLSLGSSHYQLPHYIFVAFPLAAIVTAAFMEKLFLQLYPKMLKTMNVVHIVILALMFVAVLLILTIVFPSGIWGLILWGAALAIWIAVASSRKTKGRLLWICASGIILINVFLTNFFYYHLLRYEVGAQVGRFIYDNHLAGDIVSFKINDPLNALPFYAHQVIPIAYDSSFKKGEYVLTSSEGLSFIRQHGFSPHILKQGTFYKVSELTGNFLNIKTRNTAVSRYCFVKLQ